MKARKSAAKKIKSTVSKRVKGKKLIKQKKSKTAFPPANGCPFRSGSAYATVYSILSAHPAGITRQKLIELAAKATSKSIKRAGFDVSVLLSAKESLTSKRHRSCRDGFWVQRENDHLVLKTA